MWRKSLKQITRYLMIVALLAPMILPTEARAQIYDGKREMRWDPDSKRCVGGGWNEISKTRTVNVLDFNPYVSNGDIDWDLSNGVCASYISSIGASLLAISTSSFLACTAQNPIGAGLFSVEFAEEQASNSKFPYVTPGTLVSLGLRGKQCTARSVEYATLLSAGGPASAGTIAAATDVANCCPSFTAYSLTVTAAVIALGIMYGVANGAYQKARICGYDQSSQKPWKIWDQVDSNGAHSGSGIWKKGSYEGSYKKEVQDYFLSGATQSLSTKKYREYIFGGVEYEDNGDGACAMPDWSDATKDTILGYHDKKNLTYYLTGSNEAPIFACYRFLLARGTNAEVAAGKKAYDCCSKRSQNVVCIENAPNVVGPEGYNYEYSFCPLGSRCNVKGVWFETYVGKSKTNYGCVKTYSGCPYNHPLAGGTEVSDYSDPNDLSSMQNYCQYMNHCSILPIPPYAATSSLTGAFFDSSCRDMRGDSQNVYGYSSNLTPVDVRGFSSPMAQCFKETIENIFFNRAGSTACLDPAETPDSNGTCISGYKYKKGGDLSAYQKSIGQSGDSFFVRIQSALQGTIKMALSIAIMFFGVSVLIGVAPITKKKILPWIVKIAFVMYFATGNEWQEMVLNGIIEGSAELSDIMFRTDSLTGITKSTAESKDANGEIIVGYVTDSSVDQSKLDGCQFPRYNYADNNENTKYDLKAYPPGKDYLKIWDTLDCKISRALGYGIGVSVPNLAMMIIGGLLTGGAGVIFFVATLVFAFFMIALVVRALHIFILSAISIIILFYISPIMVTMIMFAKTKDIFDKWWKNILSFALQPMILFAYLGILLTLFDNVIVGDVTFSGDGKSIPKEVVCSGSAANTSIYCIFNPPISGENGAVKTNDSLKMLGVGLPVLATMNQTKVASLIKAAVLFFILMNFLDKISDFAKALVGGDATLKSNTMRASEMMGKAYGVASGIQKRGIGMLRKNGLGAVKRVGGVGIGAIRVMGSRGKRASNAPSGFSEAGSTREGGSSASGGSSDSGNNDSA